MKRMTLRPLIAAAAVAALAQPALAETAIGQYLTFSAFGTLGAVRSSTDVADYVRERQAKGATKTPSLLVDSNLGLQLTAKANDWLSATVQSLTAERDSDELTTRFDWAYVKVTPVENLSARAGKLLVSNFLVSDSRRIGYANTALRPSNEVYGLDLLNNSMTGGDLSYAWHVGGGTLTAGASYGKSTLGVFDVKKIRNLNVVWDGDWYTLRVGQTKADPQVQAVLGPGVHEVYTFNGYGFTVDRSNVLLQGEYVQRRSSAAATLIAANAWYLQAGYRMGKWVPYASYGERKAAKSSVVNPQNTLALGARWDAFKSAALKFQLERIDTKGTGGASFVTSGGSGGSALSSAPNIAKNVTTLSVAVDFVY
ncbi:porin [Roseateles sp. SL47]|uniref:porin n=1 Tax=Roseateles sp. SL47 TaxID=2995138 RepID=UPI00227138AF|nr:porin [Roseateles sp. SL47]WAC70844.1 porin [Roseateles sp. SL47]